MSKTGKLLRVLLPAAPMAAFALRVWYALNSHPFYDEFTTMLAAREILRRGLPILPSGLFYEHGLLFTYVDAAFRLLVGGGEFGARWPGVLIGVLTVALVYRCGAEWFSPPVGLAAASIAAFAPEGVVWGGRARMYALAQILALASAYFAYRAARRERPAPGLWVLSWLLLTALLFTHFGAIIVVGPLLAALLVISRGRGARGWKSWAAWSAGAALSTAAAVWLKRLGRPMGMDEMGAGGGPLPMLSTLSDVWAAVGYQIALAPDFREMGRFLAREFGVTHHLLLAVVSLVGLAVWDRSDENGEKDPPYLYLWLVFGLTVLEMMLFLPGWRLNPRYLIVALPLFYLLAAESLARIGGLLPARWARYRAVGVLAGAAVLVAVSLPDLRIALVTPEPAYEDAFAFVRGEWREGDAVLTMNASASGLYLGRLDYFAIGQDAEQFLIEEDGREVDRWMGAPLLGSVSGLNDALSRHGRVWFVVDDVRLARYYRGDWLATVDAQMEEVWRKDGAIVYRSRPDARPLPSAPEHPLEARLGEAISLVGYAVRDDGVVLFWQTSAPLAVDYTVFVHLRDGAGNNVAQDDSQPLGGAYPTSAWRVGETVIDLHRVDTGLCSAPGCALYVGMYDLATMERLPVAGGVTGENAVRILP